MELAGITEPTEGQEVGALLLADGLDCLRELRLTAVAQRKPTRGARPARGGRRRG